MRVAIFSDIHANCIALDAVLDDCRSDNPDKIICLGDVATDGPQPRQVIQRLQDLSVPVVMGNMDAWALSPRFRNAKTERVRRITEIQQWGISQLTASDLSFLRTLQPTVTVRIDGEEGPDLLCYHGSPRSYDEGISPSMADADVEEVMGGHCAMVMAGGHTHTQMLRPIGSASVMNPGSVGAPKTPPWAEYGVVTYREDRLEISLRRVEIDVERAIEAAHESGMPHVDWWVLDRTGTVLD